MVVAKPCSEVPLIELEYLLAVRGVVSLLRFIGRVDVVRRQRDVLLPGRTRIRRAKDEAIPVLAEGSRILDVGLRDVQTRRRLAEPVAGNVIAAPPDLGFLFVEGHEALAH